MLPISVALRYLMARKSHTAVNVISAVSMAGVAVSTLAIVCVLSVFNGFSDLAASRMSVFDTDLKITPAEGKTILSSDSLATVLRSNFGEIAAAEPTIEEQALAIFADNQQAVVVKGVNERYADISSIDNAIIDGEFIVAGADDSIMKRFATIGVGTALNLGARPTFDERLRLLAPKRRGRINSANPMGAFRSDSLAIGGVFQIDQPEYDSETVIVPLTTARQLFDYTDEASAIEITLSDGQDAAKAKKAIEAFLGPSYAVRDRMEQHSVSYRMIAVEKWISLLLMIFILVIASFNVLSTLSMLVIEKRNDISIFRSLGATPSFVDRIFMSEGFLVTFTGGILGMVLGVVLCLAQQYGGFIKLGGDPSQLSIDVYPVKLELSDLAIVFAIVLGVGAVVGWAAKFIVASLGIDRREENA